MFTGLIALVLLGACRGKAAGYPQPSLAEASARYEARHPGVKRVGGAVTAPVLLKSENPSFPEKLKKKERVFSAIILEAVISDSGTVVDPVVLSQENADLHSFALDALRKWRYRPAQENGKPVAVFLTITVLLHGPRA